MSFAFKRLALPEVYLVEAVAFPDQRGFFMEAYKRSEFEANGVSDPFVQDNYSHSVRGVLRGLHYQKQPKAQGKLVMVVHGEAFAAAVDIRKGSPTYSRWVVEVLSAENHRMLYVPVGFAYGFVVLSDEVDMAYKMTVSEYAPDLGRGIIWNDPEIGIKWPQDNPILSEKDACLPLLKDADNDFVYEEKRP